MAGVSLTAPPPPFSCTLCERPGRADKAGPSCQGCPLFKGHHYFPHGEGHLDCDVLFLGDHPEKPPLLRIVKPNVVPPSEHFPFQDNAGRVVKSAVAELQREARFRGVRVRYEYAVKCAVETAPRAALHACQGPLKETLSAISAARASRGATGPLVVVTHGVTALTALGVHVKKESDAQGKVYNIRVGELDVVAVFTRSLKAIAASVGTYESTVANIAHAFAIAIQEDVKPLSREGMAAGHIYPGTHAEVKDLVEMIAAYAAPGKDPKTWAVSFDTETDTRYPTKGVTVTAVSFSWAAGKSCAIPLWHKETPYDPAPAWEWVKWLLATNKPLILHNYRYDVKVLWKMGFDIPNLRWDTLLAEHALREDAKGYYGLKELTAEFFPELAGYQNKVVELVEETEEKEIAESLKEKGRKVHEVPAEMLTALERLKLSPKFREVTLKKKIQVWEQEAARYKEPNLVLFGDASVAPSENKALRAIESVLEDARLVLAAKKAGEFKASKPKAEKKADAGDGAYAILPLHELLFYAAVDADATRRLAVLQRRRMEEEDERVAQARAKVERISRFAIGAKSFHPVKRCAYRDASGVAREVEHPRADLVTQRYVPRAKSLAKIEYHGVRIDTEYLKQARDEIEVTVREARDKIYEMAGEEFKPKSPKQLQRLICDTGIGYLHPDKKRAAWLADAHPDVFKWNGERLMYRVPDKEHGDCPIRFTGRGAVQMDAAFLKRVSAGYKDPFADLNLAWRKAATIRDNFLTNIAKLVEFYGDGWIRPGYNQPGTATGRLSSSSGVRKIGFNNQNIAKKPIGMVNCKKLFIPDNDDFLFVNIDGAGAEIGVLTAYAPDETLINAIIAGQDTHSFFSANILNPDLVADGKMGEARRAALKLAGIDDEHSWSYDDFFLGGKKESLPDKDYCRRLKELRDNIKRVVFGTLFGAGPKKIAEIAGIPVTFAKKVIELFFKRFPKVPEAIKYAKWHLKTFGFNETYFGRMRRFSIADAPSEMKARAERQGFNFLIQSTNSDIVLDVLVDLDREVADLGGRLLGTVHDSIMFQFPKRYIDQLEALVVRVGTEKVRREKPWLPVPFKWDIEVGPSYGEVVKLKDYLANREVPKVPCFEGHTEGDILDDLRAADPMESRGRKKKSS